jgi:hypothetical protein
VEPDLRTLLEAKAEEMRIDPRIPPTVLRRARRRRVASAAVAGTIVVGLALGAVVGVPALLERVPSPRPREATVGRPATAAAPIFPPSQQEIESTQAQVAQGSMPLWTDPEGTALLFAVNVLGWDMNDVEADVRGDVPVTVIITNPQLNRRVSPGADIRTAVTLKLLEGEPGPEDDIYVVMSSYAEDVQLDSPQPGEPTVPGSEVVFTGRLVRDIPGASVEASLTWEEQGGGAGSAGAPPPGGTRRFHIPMEVPGDVATAPVAAVTVHAASGEALAQTTFRLGAPEGSTTLETAPPFEAQPLPPAVEQTRASIIGAAEARNWEALRSLIDEDSFIFSFGGGRDPIRFWQVLERRGQPVLETLVRVLNTTPFPSNQFFWPAAAAKPPTEWTNEDLADMATIYTQKEIQSFREYGSYLGWRVGIARDGTWAFFVEGD